jgi:hypothetical protein
MRHAHANARAPVLLCFVLTLLAACRIAQAETFRYHRVLKSDAGWVRLTLPNDVLQACRQDLGDLRVYAGDTEVPYAAQESLLPAARVLEFRNVESRPGQETTASLDRGEHPPAIDALELSLSAGAPFLKPIVVESSTDGLTFNGVAQGSIFRTAATRNLVIGFAANDRRYLRIRLDDRLSAPVQPVSAAIHLATIETPLQSYRLVPSPTAGSDTSSDTYAVELPAANLDVVSLGVDTTEKTFSRNVRVYELLLFRDEVSRRLVTEGPLSRSPTGNTPVTLQVNSRVGRRLELEVERLARTLPVEQFVVWVRPRVLVFDAPAGPLELAYGSSTVASARYDVARALSAGPPTTWGVATLDRPVREQPGTDTKGPPRRGQRLDLKAWERRQPVILPNQGSLGFLDLSEAVTHHLSSVRIVDQTGVQVPYVLEAEVRHTSFSLAHRVATEGSHTRLTITGLDPESWIEGVGLVARAPEYFERSVDITEIDPDTQGRHAKRTLGRANWKRAPGEPPAEQWISIERPHATEIELDIDNGDDAPISIAEVFGRLAVRRIDFEFSPTEHLSLYWRNPQASPPRYDLTMIADRLFSSPAQRVRLGTLEQTRPASPTIPKWFWAATIAAGLIVALVLARALLGSPAGTKN